VREFVINDFVQHSIDVIYTPNQVQGVEGDEEHEEHAAAGASGTEVKRITVFQAFQSKLNTAKVMSFLRREPLEFLVEIPAEDSGATGRVLGRYRVDLPAELLANGVVKVKVRAQLTGHGTFQVDGAHAVVEEEVEELVKEEVTKEDGTKETVEVSKKRMKSKKVELTMDKTDTIGLSVDELIRLENNEGEMIINDNEIRQRDIARNDLEAFILKTRSMLNTDEDKAKFESILAAAEDWVYDNYDASKATLADKLNELKLVLAAFLAPNTSTADASAAESEQGPGPMNVDSDEPMSTNQ
jgi:hypothetical protein